MRQEFLSQWHNYFVLDETVENQRKPGLLKIEFDFQRGIFAALSPKTYICENDDENSMKRSSKGIPKQIKLTGERYLNVLLNSAFDNVTINQLRLNYEKNQMCTTSLTKLGLSDICVKVHIADDKITCSPLSKNGKLL